MAWSDAARAAAKEARRAHVASGRQDVKGFQSRMKAIARSQEPARMRNINRVSPRTASAMAARERLAPSSALYGRPREDSTRYERALVAQGVHPSVAAQKARRALGPGTGESHDNRPRGFFGVGPRTVGQNEAEMASLRKQIARGRKKGGY